MRLKNLIKRFDFKEDNRSRLDLSGGLRLHLHDPRVVLPGLELPRQVANPSLYSDSETLYASTWIARPLSAKEWRGFEAVIQHALDPDGSGAIVTTAAYRLTDGEDQYWWDGSAWVIDNVEWNTEAEVADNIGAFSIVLRSIGVIVNLATQDERVTPRLFAVKILYGSDIIHEDDILFRTLIPDMKAKVRPLSRVVMAHAGGTAVALDQYRPQTPYNIVDIDCVFDDTNDPNHLVDIFQSYDGGTGEITLAQDPGNVDLYIKFVYQPEIAKMTSRDYHEVGKVPSIAIDATEFKRTRESGIDDHVLNKSTNAGTRVFAPRQKDLEFSLMLMTDKSTDGAALAEEVRAYFAQNQFITSRGMDESFRLQLLGDGESVGNPDSADINVCKLFGRIVGVLFFDRGSEPITGVSNFNLIGPPNISVT